MKIWIQTLLTAKSVWLKKTVWAQHPMRRKFRHLLVVMVFSEIVCFLMQCNFIHWWAIASDYRLNIGWPRSKDMLINWFLLPTKCQHIAFSNAHFSAESSSKWIFIAATFNDKYKCFRPNAERMLCGPISLATFWQQVLMRPFSSESRAKRCEITGVVTHKSIHVIHMVLSKNCPAQPKQQPKNNAYYDRLTKRTIHFGTCFRFADIRCWSKPNHRYTCKFALLFFTTMCDVASFASDLQHFTASQGVKIVGRTASTQCLAIISYK